MGLLADRIAGGAPLRTSWPHETPLTLTERMDAQAALVRLGYNPGEPDGVVGVATRAALRAWQKTTRVPADGYLSPEHAAEIAKEEARIAGYVLTPFGRRCWIPGIADRNPARRGACGPRHRPLADDPLATHGCHGVCASSQKK